jgi:type VI secretion system protein VasG
MKGEFEKRLKDVIEDVQSSETPVILFIDEAHTLIGAGGAAGQNDAANLLKPALARGQLRCIAATTYQEYIKYFEKDPALTRRFQNILIDEPGDAQAIQMMRGIVGSLEKHHKVLVLDEALESVVKLSRRYIPARQLPDKAVSILDTACARVALSQSAEPAPIEYCRRRMEAIDTETGILEKEAKAGFPHADRIKALAEERKGEETKLADLQKRFDQEKALVAEILALSGNSAEGEKGDSKEEKAVKPDQKLIAAKRKELADLQGDSPLVLAFVGQQAVSAVISEWTGIPLGRMATSDITATLNLEAELGKRIIGQDEGISLIAKRVLTARANLADPEKPIAVIMLSGPSGVGKTETALALAEQIYGSESQMVTINMSEFQESHTVSTLKGAPPGYVGYGEGGVLTEAVRRKPYSVILLDEVEKAHPDVHEIFFQVFDKGQMEDGSGRLINFRNCIIILTTNAEGDDIKRTFPAAFLGRIQIVAYKPLGDEALYRIIDAKLGKIKKRVAENYNNAELITSCAVKDEIIRRCDNAASGARLIDAIVNNSILPELSASFLKNTMDGKEFKKVTVDVKENDFVYEFI